MLPSSMASIIATLWRFKGHMDKLEKNSGGSHRERCHEHYCYREETYCQRSGDEEEQVWEKGKGYLASGYGWYDMYMAEWRSYDESKKEGALGQEMLEFCKIMKAEGVGFERGRDEPPARQRG